MVWYVRRSIHLWPEYTTCWLIVLPSGRQIRIFEQSMKPMVLSRGDPHLKRVEAYADALGLKKFGLSSSVCPYCWTHNSICSQKISLSCDANNPNFSSRSNNREVVAMRWRKTQNAAIGLQRYPLRAVIPDQSNLVQSIPMSALLKRKSVSHW